MTITVQIVNYNSKKHLRECLNSLRKSFSGKVIFEVILVNNDAESLRELTDGQKFPFTVRTLEVNKNVGFGRANNEGAREANGECLLFLNPDTLVLPGLLESMLETLEGDPRIGIVGPLLIGEDGCVNEEHCGFKKTPLSTIYGKIKASKPLKEKNSINEVDWVSGCALMIRKSVFQELKGFDKNYFMYFEDADLCLQAKKRGYKVAVNVKAKAIHKSGKSFQSEKVKKIFYYKSQNYYLKKNFGFFAALLVRILRFPLYFKNIYLK